MSLSFHIALSRKTSLLLPWKGRIGKKRLLNHLKRAFKKSSIQAFKYCKQVLEKLQNNMKQEAVQD